ncbi:MAG: hypothetical protein ACR2OR_08870 [Hyphomicrobiales bacterium]
MNRLLLSIAFLLAGTIVTGFSTRNSAFADGNDRLNQCALYKAQANAAARNSHTAAAEANWKKYKDCLKKRID